MDHPLISVVIPYFQRDAGILRRALASVMRQQGVEQIAVVIVDDASPVPASAELATLGAHQRFPMRVILQPNRGPGAARNTALDNLDPATRFVAFLDSDDEWAEDHLSNALFALGRGFDFYFADLFQLNQSVSGFARAGRIKADDHPRILGGADSLREFRGNMLVQIVTGNVIGTPTVVYDVRKFRDVRFRTEYLNAGEDYLFWMDLAQRGARFAFSIEPEVTCGAGVNVYTGSGWGTPQHFLRIHNEMKYRNSCPRTPRRAGSSGSTAAEPSPTSSRAGPTARSSPTSCSPTTPAATRTPRSPASASCSASRAARRCRRSGSRR